MYIMYAYINELNTVFNESQGLHAKSSERTSFEDQIFWSNNDLSSAFEDEDEIIFRLALQKLIQVYLLRQFDVEHGGKSKLVLTRW